MTTGGIIARRIAKTLRGHTFIVAANDTHSAHRSQADYVCDGVADNVQIQAAIDALPTTGGTVLLLEGTYVLAAGLTFTAKNDWTLKGVGDGLSRLSCLDSITRALEIVGCNRWRLSGIYFLGTVAGSPTNTAVALSPDAADAASPYGIIKECLFSQLSVGIRVGESYVNVIRDNEFDTCDQAIIIDNSVGSNPHQKITGNTFGTAIGTNPLIDVLGLDVTIEGNSFEVTNTINKVSIRIQNGSQRAIIANNILTTSGGFSIADSTQVVGNVFYTCVADLSNRRTLISVTGNGDYSTIANNVFKETTAQFSSFAIDCSGDYCSISGNTIAEFVTGIRFNGSGTSVVGNVVRNTVAAGNTGITAAAGGAGGVVHGNSVVGAATPYSNAGPAKFIINDLNAAPTTGTWQVGDVVFYTTPTAGGGANPFIGSVCTTAGTPGTWRTFGAVS